MLKIPHRFVRECCSFAARGEKHHVSKYYNLVDYYDTEILQLWIVNDEEANEDAGISFETALAAWKERLAAARAVGPIVNKNVTVAWLDWGGTRIFPTKKERKVDHCTVIDRGGKMLTVELSDGTSFKKGRDTRGFSFRPST